jgi:hypothetical protein
MPCACHLKKWGREALAENLAAASFGVAKGKT